MAITGIQTVSSPASRLPIPVTQVMHAMMAIIRLFETSKSSSFSSTISTESAVPALSTVAGCFGEEGILVKSLARGTKSDVEAVEPVG
ncbi:hypothetical protein NQZ79_g8898 [Umbelopsis isabellina]|nr:hypothetical protein NQZ79_g8898 [Umbelopsis isabellina]